MSTSPILIAATCYIPSTTECADPSHKGSQGRNSPRFSLQVRTVLSWVLSLAKLLGALIFPSTTDTINLSALSGTEIERRKYPGTLPASTLLLSVQTPVVLRAAP